MKKWFPVFLTAILLGPSLRAQHCPFDGSSAVIIRLPDIQGSLDKDSSLAIFLVETDTLLADSCTYAEGALKIKFRSINDALVKKYPNTWEYRAGKYVLEAPFNQSGLLTVVLNQAQASCMLKRNNEFNYVKRKFELHVVKDGRIIQQLPVPPEKIFSLCTSAGPWTRIQPVEIVLPD